MQKGVAQRIDSWCNVPFGRRPIDGGLDELVRFHMGLDLGELLEPLEVGCKLGELGLEFGKEQHVDGDDLIEMKVGKLWLLSAKEILVSQEGLELFHLLRLGLSQALLQVLLKSYVRVT